jgi:hypothetical protein
MIHSFTVTFEAKYLTSMVTSPERGVQIQEQLKQPWISVLQP